MKVLWLYWNDPKKNDSSGLSRRIHYGFVTKLNRLKDVELVIYGPGQRTASALTPIPFDGKLRSKLPFSYLKRKLKPDVVLLYTQGNVAHWIPSDFKDSQVPKVMVECDWWYITKKNWYKEHNIDLMIQRGSVDTAIMKMPSVWLPFSAAEEDFAHYQEVPIKDRQKIIGFVGRGAGAKMKNASVYQSRYKALQLLRQQKLVEVKGQVGHEEYPSSLFRFMCCFSDCGRLHSPPAKTFEIMASGSLLLTDNFIGYERLFGDKEVCKFWNRDRKDLVKVARSIVNGDTDELQAIVDNAVAEVNRKHLDKHRIVEFAGILKSYLKDNTVVKRWGI